MKTEKIKRKPEKKKDKEETEKEETRRTLKKQKVSNEGQPGVNLPDRVD